MIIKPLTPADSTISTDPAPSMTPMREQYLKLKEAHAGFILFYRMGDFYEMFDEQAILASGILGITLTQRRKNKDEEGIPMCGIPYHAAEGYIAKLIKAGQKVAVCEQTETPEEAKQKRGYKALVNRQAARLYTGGTITEDSMLNDAENNYLVSLAEQKGQLAIGWLDLSTGEFLLSSLVSTINGTSGDNKNSSNKEKEQAGLNLLLSHELARLNPSEIILSAELADKYSQELAKYSQQTSIIADYFFEASQGEKVIHKVYETSSLDSYGFAEEKTNNNSKKLQLSICGALLQYIEDTQKGSFPALKRPKVLSNNHFLKMDSATRNNLEIIHNLKGERKGSLLDCLDKTVTSAGGRTLASWLVSPLQDLEDIHARQEAIKVFKEDFTLRSDLQQLLKQTADTGRVLSRITAERGSPRDLGALRATLKQLPSLNSLLRAVIDNPELTKIIHATSGFEQLEALLEKALEESNLPMLAREGGFVRSGFCEKFDGYKKLATGGMEMLKNLEREQAERLGISSLKIKYNKVWGYFIEITKSHASKVPEDYIHRQTTTNAQRFSIPELMNLEQEYSAAQSNSLARELEIFASLISAVKQLSAPLLNLAEGLATLDVFCSGGEIADNNNYCQPEVDDSCDFEIKNGRHPVVESTVEQFISNDCQLSNSKLWLITGPNMAGKSTFLRQNALISIMAHCGFFVPANSAKIGIIDRIFTRIGAGDDLAQGQSTFMMEMVETATILNHATEKSFVVLDEIGRGTATYDGLSIAWACVEHLVSVNKSRGLFATHYHEMTELENAYPNLICHHVTVKEWQGSIIFMHKIAQGCSPHSYGIHVGKLAGLPSAVTRRAETILERLEANSQTSLIYNHNNTDNSNSKNTPNDMAIAKNQTSLLPLFSEMPEVIIEKETSKVEEKLLDISLDDLSPRQAQDLLYELKNLTN